MPPSAIAGDLSDQARTQRDALPERTAALAASAWDDNLARRILEHADPM